MMNFRKQGVNINNFEAKVLNKAQADVLKCGIPIYRVHGETMGLLRIDFVFEAGLLQYNNAQITQNTLALLREGSEKYNPKEISDILDYNAVFSKPYMNRNIAGWSFHIDQNALNEVLPVITDFIFRSNFPENELEIYKQNTYQRLQIELEKPKFIAQRKLNNLIFGNNHPHGVQIELEDIAKINRDELLEFHRNYYTPQNCKIIVAGDTDLNINEILNHHISPYFTQDYTKPETPKLLPETSNEKFIQIEKPEATQAAIRIGGLINFNNFEEYHMLKVVNMVLGGYFGSRLMKNIREEKGLTYGIGSFVQFCDGKSLFNIVAEVKGSKWQEAVDEIKNELHNLWATPLSDEELDMIKKTMFGGLLSNFEGAFESAEVRKHLLELKQDYSFYEDAIKAIHLANEKTIQNIAKEKFNFENLTTVVVGP